MKFVKDSIRNETLGIELRDILLAHGYKMIDAEDWESSIDVESIALKLDTAEYHKVRKIVMEFLNAHGYVKEVKGTSGTKYLNAENNEKRAYYSVNSCMRNVDGELKDWVYVFIIFETR